MNASGFEVSYDASKETPFEYAGRAGQSATYAMTLAKAHDYWGWGTVAELQADEAVQQLSKDDELLGILDAYEKRGKKTRVQFAAEVKLSEFNLKKRL